MEPEQKGKEPVEPEHAQAEDLSDEKILGDELRRQTGDLVRILGLNGKLLEQLKEDVTTAADAVARVLPADLFSARSPVIRGLAEVRRRIVEDISRFKSQAENEDSESATASDEQSHTHGKTPVPIAFQVKKTTERTTDLGTPKKRR